MGSHTWHHGCDTIWLPGFVRKHEVSHSAFPTYPVLQKSPGHTVNARAERSRQVSGPRRCQEALLAGWRTHSSAETYRHFISEAAM